MSALEWDELRLAPRWVERGLRWRPETAEDLPFLRGLFVEARWEEFRSLPWDDAGKRAFLEQQFDFRNRHYRQCYATAFFGIVERNDRPVGRLCVVDDGADVRVVDIALIAESCNRGWGRFLLEAVQSFAAAHGKGVVLQVEQHNRAGHLYERLGFVAAGQQGPYRAMRWCAAGDVSAT